MIVVQRDGNGRSLVHRGANTRMIPETSTDRFSVSYPRTRQWSPLQTRWLHREPGVDLYKRLIWCCTVPVDDIRRSVVGSANTKLLHRVASLLRPHPALLDHQQLPTIVTVPVS